MFSERRWRTRISPLPTAQEVLHQPLRGDILAEKRT
jgi:hypothetical protein